MTYTVFKAYDTRNQTDVRLVDLDFGALRESSEVGDAYVAELETQWTAHKASSQEGGEKRRRKADEPLWVKEPGRVGLPPYVPSLHQSRVHRGGSRGMRASNSLRGGEIWFTGRG